MKPRIRRILLASLLVVLALPLTAWAMWPLLLEGYVQKKLETALERRFTSVQIGSFDLGRTGLRATSLVLSNEGARVEIEELESEFVVDWRHGEVGVANVAVRGGSITGDLEGLKKLRSSSGSASSTSSKVSLEGVELLALDIDLEIEAQGHTVRGELKHAATTGFSAPVTALFDNISFEHDETLTIVQELSVDFDLGQSFPRTANIAITMASVEDLASLFNVSGTITVSDAEISSVQTALSGFSMVQAAIAGLPGEDQMWTFAGGFNKEPITPESRVTASLWRVASGAGFACPSCSKLEPADPFDYIGWGRLSADGIHPWQLPGAKALPILQTGLVSVDLSMWGSSSQRQRLYVAGRVRLDGVYLEHPRLAPDPVRLDVDVELATVVNFDTVYFDQVTVVPLLEGKPQHALELELRGELSNARDSELRHFTGRVVSTEPSSCQGLLEAIPQGLAPALKGFELEGSTVLDLSINVDMADPEATELDGGLDLDTCRIKEVPPTVAALSGPFNHIVRMKNGRAVSRLMGPGAPYFAPLAQLPSYVAAAVVATEDGGFWHHDGFLENQIKASLQRNVELGELRRGGSTITMQMVKNVLLSHEKTISRKLQELLLTWVVEEQLPKTRIMELYLNAIEFGPGIYGIGHAAQHYFDKPAHEITSLEAAFLATLLPRPVERHEMWCRGGLTEKHLSYVHKIHQRMLARGVISQEQFDLAEDLGVVFGRSQWSSTSTCLAEGRAVQEGKHVQAAVSGLLVSPIDR